MTPLPERAAAATRRITVPTAPPYDVVIGRGASEEIPDLLAARFGGRRLVLITDETVSRLHAGPVMSALASAGALATPQQTATYRTVVDNEIERGDPDDSRVIELMGNRGGGLQMPPLATERRDDAGYELIRTWIRGL